MPDSEPRASRFALGLGANLPQDDSPAPLTLARAIASLRAEFGPLDIAPLFRTDPISAIPQGRYFNTAVSGLTTQPPEELLSAAWRLEATAGRPNPAQRRHHAADGPRTLDVDLLLYGDLVLQRPELTLPHPRLHQRRFVLAPLAAILPDARVPPDNVRVADLLFTLDAAEAGQATDAPRVERIDWPALAQSFLEEAEA